MINHDLEEARSKLWAQYLSTQAAEVVLFLLILVCITIIFPGINLPLNLMTLFSLKFSIWPLIAGIPLFVLVCFMEVKTSKENAVNNPVAWNYKPIRKFADDTLMSIISGIAEEAGRWAWLAILLSFIGRLSLGNFVSGTLILGTILTFGLVKLAVVAPFGWQVGVAAVLDALGFSVLHKHASLINSWILFYLGFVLMLTMLTSGLFAAMFVHFAYDFMIDIIEFSHKRI